MGKQLAVPPSYDKLTDGGTAGSGLGDRSGQTGVAVKHMALRLRGFESLPQHHRPSSTAKLLWGGAYRQRSSATESTPEAGCIP